MGQSNRVQGGPWSWPQWTFQLTTRIESGSVLAGGAGPPGAATDQAIRPSQTVSKPTIARRPARGRPGLCARSQARPARAAATTVKV
ncbi:MAG: hypothetical protein U0797_05095 [Gemmataceae bacterium]